MEAGIIVAPAWYAAIPFVALGVLAFASISLADALGEVHPSAGSRIWPALSAVMLLFASVWCLLGNYVGDLPSWIAFSAVVCASGIISGRRDGIRMRIVRAGVVARTIRDVICLVLAVASCLLALELPWNERFPALEPASLALEVGLIALLVVTAFFLAQRTGALCGLVVALAAFVGLSQHFLIMFKGTTLLPGDLFALGTAAAVSEGYIYYVSARVLWGLMAAYGGFAALSMLGPAFPARAIDDLIVIPVAGKHSAPAAETARRGLPIWATVLVNLALAVAGGAAIWWCCARADVRAAAGITIDYADTVDTYEHNGFLSSFVAALQDFPIKEPEGYTQEAAEAAERELAARYDAEVGSGDSRTQAVQQFSEDMPSVVVVMNEAFSDLSIYDGLRADYEGPAAFKAVPNALARGSLAVSVLGGGTCNTEFELLTGHSLAFIGAGKYPYAIYDLTDSDSMARQLRRIGYATHAIHPNLASNWNRATVYEALGFDEFHDITEFEGAPEFHMGVTDAATYDKALELLALDGRPQFIFDVTMQGHSSYDRDDIPEDRLTSYQPEGDFTAEQVAELNEYLSCVNAADADLAAFMEELAKLDRKVVLVFFGDHQPYFTPVFNDAFFAGEDELTHQERTHQTSYLIWANYDVMGRDESSPVDDTSADLLGMRVFDLIGAPLTDFQKAKLAIRRAGVSATNLLGYRDADGAWHQATDAGEYRSLYDELAAVSYLEFGSKVR